MLKQVCNAILWYARRSYRHLTPTFDAPDEVDCDMLGPPNPAKPIQHIVGKNCSMGADKIHMLNCKDID
jgi:hypothetical protein